MAMPGVQTLRFRRPTTRDATIATPQPKKPPGFVPNRRQVFHRAQRSIWLPGLSVGFRLLVLWRFSAAMYANIQDCDEVYNFWEPLHYLQHGHGFQTWETSPNYAIRSWAYILLHLPFARAATLLMGMSNRRSFFAVRATLAVFSSFCEARFYRSVGEHMNDHIARYLLFMLLFSPGMWNASSAFLPSSFAMYFITLAASFYMRPPSMSSPLRTLSAVACFAIGAVVGWPFALLLAVPFVLEEISVWGGDRVPPDAQLSWLMGRWKRLILCGVIASLVFVPVVFIDSLAYGKLAVVPWNIVQYNVFGGEGRGPELYGTEPWYFYIQNLLLNFNILLPLALFSLPALGITHVWDHRRLGLTKTQPGETSPYTLVILRLAPFYIWTIVLSSQPHKEERFMYPAFPLLCFNAATTLYLIRGWLEAIYTKAVSVYAASQTKLFGRFTLLVITLSAALSGARILALFRYYHAPFDVSYYFEHNEIPRLLNVTGLLPPPKPQDAGYNPAYADDEYVDINGLKQIGVRVCYGKEWYRFPSHYLFPDGVEVQFVRSGFSGLLPQHFATEPIPSEGLWKRGQTRVAPPGLNDMNREEPSVYIDISACHYLVDVDFPLQDPFSDEPRYVTHSETWDPVYCAPFLDAVNSPMLTRTLYTGLAAWQERNKFGNYCLLRNRALIAKIESEKWAQST